MRTTADRLCTALAWTAGLAVPAGLAVLVGFVALRGASAGGLAWLSPDAERTLWPAAAGTLLLVAGSCAIAVPVGIATGIDLACGTGRRIDRMLRAAVELLASVPSILLGLLGYSALLLVRRTVAPGAHAGLVLAAACLAILVLPSIVVTTAAAIEGLPERIRILGPSLGMSRWQSVRRVLVPCAGRGILAGLVLAVGRSAEDTAVILLTGVVANAGVPQSPADRFEALPFKIFYLAAEHRTSADLDAAFGAALLLLLVTVVLTLGASALERGLGRRWETRA